MKMEIPVYAPDGTVNSKIEFESEVSNESFNSGLIHEITTMQFAGLRSGNASTKTRGEVSGGGKKPYRKRGQEEPAKVPRGLPSGEVEPLFLDRDLGIIPTGNQVRKYCLP